MGAWGPGSFDNDSAHDWLAELDGVQTLRSTFTRVTKAKATQYIDVDDASAVIAAAEVVAAQRGHAMTDAPESIAAWLDAQGDALTAADATLAEQAVARVAKSSELQELWADHGAKNPWTREIDGLRKRLTAKLRARARRAPATTSGRAKRVASGPAMRHVESPDGEISASVIAMDRLTSAMIAPDERGVLIAAECRFDQMDARWLDDATLEVRYPAGTKLVGTREKRWSWNGRTVAVRYIEMVASKQKPAKASAAKPKRAAAPKP